MRVPWRHWPAAAALLALLLAWQPVQTGPAERFNDAVFESALTVYAILRGINAVISVAKETEIGVELVGSVTTQPAMILDPLDETVARVADAIFALATASGVLSIGLEPLARIGGLLAAAGFAALWLARSGAGGTGDWGLRPLGTRLAGLGLLLAVALPLAYAAAGALGALWTEDRRVAAQEVLLGTEERLSEAVASAQQDLSEVPDTPETDRTGAEGASIWSRVLDGARDAGGAANSAVRAAVPDMDTVQLRGAEIFESSVELVAIFVFRLFVVPIFVLLALWAVARYVLSR